MFFSTPTQNTYDLLKMNIPCKLCKKNIIKLKLLIKIHIILRPKRM